MGEEEGGSQEREIYSDCPKSTLGKRLEFRKKKKKKCVCKAVEGHLASSLGGEPLGPI